MARGWRAGRRSVGRRPSGRSCRAEPMRTFVAAPQTEPSNAAPGPALPSAVSRLASRKRSCTACWKISGPPFPLKCPVILWVSGSPRICSRASPAASTCSTALRPRGMVATEPPGCRQAESMCGARRPRGRWSRSTPSATARRAPRILGATCVTCSWSRTCSACGSSPPQRAISRSSRRTGTSTNH